MTATPAADGTAAKAAPRRRPKDRKQQIILAARDLFVERGFPNVSMAMIAERVGITAGALYRHFANKQVLLQEVISESFSYLDEGVAGETFEEVVDDAIERQLHHPYGADLWTNEVRHLPEEQRTKLRRRMRTWAKAFAPRVREARPDLDPWQLDLVAWGLQSVFACLGSLSLHVPQATRRPVVRAAALSLVSVDLLPAGDVVPAREAVLAPASTRERLLLAAIDQFTSRGYQETSMSSIGAAADVTGPNLYGYFASKLDLVRAVHDRAAHTMWLTVDGALGRATTPREALELLVEGHVELAKTWSQFRMDLPDAPELSEANRVAQGEYVEEWVAVLRQVVSDLSAREARLRVQIAVKVINDLPRTPRVAGFEAFPANLARLALTILTDGAARA